MDCLLTSPISHTVRDDENRSYHTASDANSENSPSPVQEVSSAVREAVMLKDEEPITPRSIPYRDYLRRWRMVKSAGSLVSNGLQAYIGPTLTVFEPLNIPSERLFQRFAMKSSAKLPPAFRILQSKDTDSETGLNNTDVQCYHQAVTVDVPDKLSILLTPMFLKLVEEVLEEVTSKVIFFQNTVNFASTEP